MAEVDGGTVDRSTREIRPLTGLRVVAATWVVLVHSQGVLAPFLDQVPPLKSVVGSGWLGVDLFFVLSGFVLALRYVAELGSRPRPGSVALFLVNRVARVWPAWAVVTLVMGAWLWGVERAGVDPDVLTPHADVTALGFLEQLAMVQLWGEDSFFGTQFLLPGWSLSAEWLAYLCFPVLAVVAWRLRRLPAGLLVLLSCAAVLPLAVDAFRSGTVSADQSWLLRIGSEFTAGMLAALAAQRLRRTDRTESLALAFSVLSLLGIAGSSLWNTWRRGTDYGVDFSGVAVLLFPVLVLSLSLTERGPAAVLARPAFVYGGRISYCLYLCHFLVLEVGITLLWRDPEQVWVITPGFALLMPVLLAVAFGLSAVLHRYVEEPGRRRILALLTRRPRQPDAPSDGPVPPGRPAPGLPARSLPPLPSRPSSADVPDDVTTRLPAVGPVRAATVPQVGRSTASAPVHTRSSRTGR